MALEDRLIESEKLGFKNRIKIFVPDSGKKSYPAVYMHHGLGYDEQTPWQQCNLAAYAAEYDLIVVTSNAEDSWFCNDRRVGRLWEDYFAFELPAYIENEFPAAPEMQARGQCGFSMGGYGAMMLTMLHSDRFAAVSVHSGSFIFGHEYRKDRPEREVLMKAVAPPGGRYDLFDLERSRPELFSAAPAIRFDVGDRDHLLDQSRRFHAYLDNIGLKHEYVENSGSHLWSYVDEHLEESLAFLAGHLSLF